ncbi:MAG TPA: hypothetical protein VEZ14_05190 [Dehalococcoidia bacterium]|nr:hypothetical protein [Dehalococcoidia bacterium]
MTAEREGFRPLNETERAILDRLLEVSFPGRDELRAQLEAALVRPWAECAEHCPSVEFLIESDVRLPDYGSTVVPVEGMASDADGIPIEILLFCRDGTLHDLEFVIFSDRMKRMPRPSEIEVRAGHDPWPEGYMPPPLPPNAEPQ